jgi:XRE family transcriptional regulator, regulator of sulfur utilization
MKSTGMRIRAERQKLGMTLEDLANEVGISSITLHRIETGKTSPSVFVLSKIASTLNKPVASFIEEPSKAITFVKNADQKTVSAKGFKTQIVAPRKMIKGNIEVVFGELTRIDPHTNHGMEWAYVLEGKCEQRIGDQTYITEKGDSICYDARTEHCVTAIGDSCKFISIFVEDEEP